MKNKNKNVGSYVAVVIILVVALVFIFYMLEQSKENLKANPTLNETTETTTTTEITTHVIGSTNTDATEGENDTSNNTSTVVNNFGTSLSTIIYGLNLTDNFKVETTYEGAKFNFNCSEYDEENYTCKSGSALMTIDDVLIPLFTYSNDEENYFLNPIDYFIKVEDNYILLAYSHVGVSSGELKLFNRSGELLSKVTGLINGFKVGDELNNRLYPEINNNVLSFNVCEENSVIIKTIDLSVPTNVLSAGTQANSSCY